MRDRGPAGPPAGSSAGSGDVLAVGLLDLQHEGWGFTTFLPGEVGLGLLPEDFPEPGIHVRGLDGDVGRFVDGIEVPLAPFPGTIGVAPAEAGSFDTLPPWDVGGNKDVKHLTAGSTLQLPVLGHREPHAAPLAERPAVVGIRRR